MAPGTAGSVETRGSLRMFCSLRDRPALPRPINDKLLLIDGLRYDGSTIIASLQAGLVYPNPHQDFDNSTTRRQDRDPRAPYVGDNRMGSPPCSATRWAYRMRDASGANTMYIKT